MLHWKKARSDAPECIHNFINDACMGTCMVEFSVGNMAAFIISCIEVSMGRVFCPYKGFGSCQQ